LLRGSQQWARAASTNSHDILRTPWREGEMSLRRIGAPTRSSRV